MNAYEITFIVRPDLGDDAIDAMVGTVQNRVTSSGGEILATAPFSPARRRMSYPIRDFGDGVYITIWFNLDPEAVRPMERALRLNESILRFLVVQASELSVKNGQQREAQRAAALANPPQPPTPAAAPAGEAGESAPTLEGAAPAVSPELAGPATENAGVTADEPAAPPTTDAAQATETSGAKQAPDPAEAREPELAGVPGGSAVEHTPDADAPTTTSSTESQSQE